jgi:hypothetical protein
MKMAVRETIGFITQRFPKLSREEAYMIASVAVDYHVTEVVDGTKGIHGMAWRRPRPCGFPPKLPLAGPGAALWRFHASRCESPQPGFGPAPAQVYQETQEYSARV